MAPKVIFQDLPHTEVPCVSQSGECQIRALDHNVVTPMCTVHVHSHVRNHRIDRGLVWIWTAHPKSGVAQVPTLTLWRTYLQQCPLSWLTCWQPNWQQFWDPRLYMAQEPDCRTNYWTWSLVLMSKGKRSLQLMLHILMGLAMTQPCNGQQLLSSPDGSTLV